jgi:hypothetical protein
MKLRNVSQNPMSPRAEPVLSMLLGEFQDTQRGTASFVDATRQQ